MSNDLFVKLAHPAVLARDLTDPRSLSSRTQDPSKCAFCIQGWGNADGVNTVVTSLSGAQLCSTNSGQAPIACRPERRSRGAAPPWAAARRARGGGRKLGRAARTPGGPAGLSLRRVSPRPGPFWSRVCCLGGGDDGGSRTRPKFTKITRDSVSRGRRGALSLAAARVRNRRRCPTGRA